MMATLPPFYVNDELMKALFLATGNELQRIEDAAIAIAASMFPQNADDTYGMLAIWEGELGLPIKPAASIATRRQLVLARLQTRNRGYGSDWVAAMTAAIGSNWTYQETPADSKITIYFPWASGSFSAVQIEGFARLITPAHEEVDVVFDRGFVIGEGHVGEDRL